MILLPFLLLLSNMQRLFVTILAIIYMGTSTGATIQLHYCMGKMVGMKLWHSETKTGKCDNCGMKKSTASTKKCCKDVHKIVKLENGHYKSSENGLQFLAVVTITPVSFIEYSKVGHTSAAHEFPVSHAPPRKLPIHILHCTYRI